MNSLDVTATISYNLVTTQGIGQMAIKAPGKHHREGLTLVQLMNMFPDDEAAREWFTSRRWPDSPYCPYCGSFNVQSNIKHKTMTHRCRDCSKRPMFSLRTGTLMEGSNLTYRDWAIAIYLVSTNLKGVSSMKLHRDLGITQKSAWYLAHRLRKAFEPNNGPFAGPVEADETYVGGKRKNMPKAKRNKLKGRGSVGKTAVVGAKDRATNAVSATVVGNTDAKTLQGFVGERAAKGATVYTDDHGGYQGMPFKHETVKHSISEYVDGMAHTNGIESFWSLLKRGYHGTYHHMSEKHLNSYVQEFAGRHNIRDDHTVDQMTSVVLGMNGKRLKYRDLIA